MFCFALSIGYPEGKNGCNRPFFMNGTPFLVSFFPLMFITCVGCKTPSLGEIYSSPRYVLIREHRWIMIIFYLSFIFFSPFQPHF